MQKDMHFYGVYSLARAAGVKQQSASVIAYASQYVDDAMEDREIILKNSAILPTMTSHKPLDYQNTLPGDQWNVWVPFHFLPGNDASAKTFAERMICCKDSSPAQQMMQWAIEMKGKPYAPHLAGIAAHVYADTFSHHGFMGLSSSWNKVKNETLDLECEDESIREYLGNRFEQFKMRVVGSLAETVPVGHGSVGTFPDRPYLRWNFDYENHSDSPNRKNVQRNNLEDYVEASEKMFGFFKKFAVNNPVHADGTDRKWSDLKDPVLKILKIEKPEDDRIDAWIKNIRNKALFDPVEDDLHVSYSEKAWRPAMIACLAGSCSDPTLSDPCLFIKASNLFREFVLTELLPDQGLLTRVYS